MKTAGGGMTKHYLTLPSENVNLVDVTLAAARHKISALR